MERRFYIATEEEIISGKVTDIYFARTREILEKTGKAEKKAYAEIHAYGFPKDYKWAIAAGISEVAKLLEGKPVNVYSLEEGEFFRIYEPVMALEGRYVDYGVYESSLLGILRHATSVATKAARIRIGVDASAAWNACALPWKLVTTVDGTCSSAVAFCTAATAVPTAVPGARLKLSVTDGNWL